MNPEALNKTEAVTFTGLQKWCEAIITELIILAAKATPEDREVIDALVDEINEEKVYLEASTVTNTDPNFGEIKSRLVKECENKLDIIASISARELFTAAEERASKLP